ncbi:hypothetical protein B0O80DRAFT_406714, partial [Mortierella sp. GBAus27b]
MSCNSIVLSPKGTLLPQQILELATIFLERANKSGDHDIVPTFCHHVGAILSQLQGTTKTSATSTDPEEQIQHNRVAEVCFHLGKLMDDREYHEQAKAFYNKALELDPLKMLSQPRILVQSNRHGEWSTGMLINCCGEGLRVDDHHRSQLGHQGAVIIPFTVGQEHEYITQYVSLHLRPETMEEYNKNQQLIASLKALMKSPVLLEVLRCMVNPNHDRRTTHIYSRKEAKQFLRLVLQNLKQYRFHHRSMLEYGAGLEALDPRDQKDQLVLDINSPLASRLFVDKPSALLFLEERVRQDPQFKKQLLDYIELSKTDKKWRKAASNAITILVLAGVQFNGADLRGIRIPRANLSYGIFDSAQLQGADLTRVDLRGVWLRHANLTGARMAGTHFREPTYLMHDSMVKISTYSPDGESLAVGLGNGRIVVYSTATWEPLHTWSDHGGAVNKVVYTPNGKLIVSASQDKTVRIWDMETGVCFRTLEGHDCSVWSVSYSPQRHQVVSSSDDLTLRIWDVEAGTCLHTMR